jgi:hypothetical protein
MYILYCFITPAAVDEPPPIFADGVTGNVTVAVPSTVNVPTVGAPGVVNVAVDVDTLEFNHPAAFAYTLNTAFCAIGPNPGDGGLTVLVANVPAF